MHTDEKLGIHATEIIYNETYLSKKKISSGSFGVVYFGIDLKTNEAVAIKVEKTEGNDEMKSVLKEASILSILHDLKGVPKLFWAGTKNKVDVMVISLLGKDLTSYLKIFKRFSLKNVVMLADQLVSIIESVHNKGVVHRDLKPENILMGKGDKHDQCYLVDYGISKVYKDVNGTHIPYRDKKSFIGTTRYASISAHSGIEISRKDDLESLIYVLVFLYKGNLPWQNLKVSENEKTKKVGEMKLKLSSEEICKDMPEEFVKFLNYVKNLSFKQNPDYIFLKGLISKIAYTNNFLLDNVWDWIMPLKIDFKKKPSEKDDAKKVIDAKNPNVFKPLDHRKANNNADSFLNINNSPKRKADNTKVPKISSSSHLNFADISSDLLRVPDLNKSGDNSQNSSFMNMSVNNSLVAKCPNSFILTEDLEERENEGFFNEKIIYKGFIFKRNSRK